MANSPYRNDGVTMSVSVSKRCPSCGRRFTPAGRQRFCSAACRQAAWRRRHAEASPILPTTAPRSTIVYECPACDARFLGEQRCSDCNVFCRRVGPGGPCPHCDEPVALTDLLGASDVSALPVH